MTLKEIIKKIIPVSIQRPVRKSFLYVFYLFPVNPRKVLFMNFDGRGFGGDPKYICLEMLKQNLNLDFVWPLKSMREEIPLGVRKVKKRSLKFYYEIATSKMIVLNTAGGSLTYSLVKKKNQFIIETWHGSHALKYIEHQAKDTLSKYYLISSDETVDMVDVFISDGPQNTQFYRDSFHCTCPIIETGMPHEDILFSKDAKSLKLLRDKLGIAKDKKILLYAPTFRDDGAMDAYDLDFSKVMEVLKQRFSGDWVTLLRLHPNVQHADTIPTDGKSIINVSSYGDAQELIAISDALITDYSSIYHDFFVSNKPVFLYTKDLEHYMSKDRHLRPIYFELGLKHNKTQDSLLQDIQNFNMQDYQELLADYKKKTGAIADGKAAYRVVEYLKKYL